MIKITKRLRPRAYRVGKSFQLVEPVGNDFDRIGPKAG